MRRRTLLAGGGLVVLFGATGCSLPVVPKRPQPQAKDAQGWVHFTDGHYTLFVPRAEMGQNIATAMKQVACEALGVEPDFVQVQLASTRDMGRVRATVGSESIKDFALPLAQACVALRKAVRAGRTQGVLDLRDGLVPTSLQQALPEPRRWVGRNAPLEQATALLLGEALFAADVRRSAQRFGRVLRSPTAPELESRLERADEDAARKVPGFVALVRDPLLRHGLAEGVGIVATTPGTLDRIEAALSARWQVSDSFTQETIDAAIDVDRRLAAGRLRHKVHGDAVGDGAQWDVDLHLNIPLAAHGALQPRAAVAEWSTDGALAVWTGTQDPFYTRDVLVKRLGIDEARVVVHACRIGGAFGGKTVCSVELEAAVLARAAGAPVKVQWSRPQELQHGFHRPPSSHRVRARLKDGRLDQWWHAFASSNILFTNAVLPAWLQGVATVLGDGGVARGAMIPYRVTARRVEYDLERLAVPTGPWRGLGAGPNGTAIECAIDECARAARMDPVRFRLDHIEDPRLARVVRRVADASDWGRAAPLGTGRGVACGIYKGSSYAAVVADVAVEHDGRLRVTRMWCAHDCGLVVNPDQIRAQCEGNLVWGIGMVLSDQLPVADGQVAARSFSEAPLPTLADVPMMDVLLVDEDDPPSGAGETAIVAAAGAILNAIRAATGQRITRLPVRTLPVRPFRHE